ncbi:MAG: tyrosine-protein phosphatase [Victivallales bacterium]|nr:tyrosine-protein phosphatase [Victivallales bacterium]
MKRQLSLLVFFLPILSVLAELSILSPKKDATVTLIKEPQRNFLMMSREERKALSFDPEKARAMRVSNSGDLPQPLTLEWSDTTPAEGKTYNVTVKRLPDGKLFFSATTDKLTAQVVNLEIARNYEWTVTTKDGQATSTFKTEDRAPRLLQFATVRNARDFGGRIGIDGRRVKQSKMFRTSGLNHNAQIVYYKLDEVMQLHEEGKLAGMGDQGQKLERQIKRGEKIDPKFIRLIKSTPSEPGKLKLNDEQRQFILDTFGIKTDIDLRSDMECYGMTGSPLGPTVKWYQWSYSKFGYGYLFTDDGYKSFKTVFTLMIDEANYPIVFHCIGGADRTGVLATMLNALLGVEEDELAKDYEATWFSSACGVVDKVHREWFEAYLGRIKKYDGANLREKAENFAIQSCGVTMEEINKFREIMLEEPR